MSSNEVIGKYHYKSFKKFFENTKMSSNEVIGKFINYYAEIIYNIRLQRCRQDNSLIYNAAGNA